MYTCAVKQYEAGEPHLQSVISISCTISDLDLETWDRTSFRSDRKRPQLFNWPKRLLTTGCAQFSGLLHVNADIAWRNSGFTLDRRCTPSSVAGREIFVSHNSGRVTAYPEITPKMEFCPDWRPSSRNSQDGTESELETCLRLFSSTQDHDQKIGEHWPTKRYLSFCRWFTIWRGEHASDRNHGPFLITRLAVAAPD